MEGVVPGAASSAPDSHLLPPCALASGWHEAEMRPRHERRTQGEFGTGGKGFAVRLAGSFLEMDAWIPSEIKVITPVLELLMRLIEEPHCITGEELTVELALREALNNALVHGNRLDTTAE